MVNHKPLRRRCLVGALLLLGVGGSGARAHDLGHEIEHSHASGSGRLKMLDATQAADSAAIGSELTLALFGQLEAGGATAARPAAAEIFTPFKDQVKVRWDERWLYVESNGMPDHRMMVGITAWQQQVPLPQAYTGGNAWQVPLHPVVAKEPLSAKSHFFRGAIALAANGVPIFNPIKNDGKTDTFIAGELDEFGGHCGRGDDYHYHIAPLHLEALVGKGKPIAYALDGYPIYGLTEPDGSAVGKLDEFNGHTDAKGNYHYHATKAYPYLNGGFHGEVVDRGGQVDPQPRASGVREDGRPLRGAKITAFTFTKPNAYSLVYEVNGKKNTINYRVEADGSYPFEFIDDAGKSTTQTYHRRGGGNGGAPRQGARGDQPAQDAPARPTAGAAEPGERKPDGGGQQGGDFHLLPRFVEEKLTLTDEQNRQIAQLAEEIQGKLAKILTAEQMKTLQGSRPPGGPGSPPADAPAGGQRAQESPGRPAADGNAKPPADEIQKPLDGFKLTSSEVKDGGALPKEFTGDGASATLPLEWGGAPAGTKSFAIIMHHSPGPGDVKWYWIVYNIPADVHSLAKNVSGVGTLGNNSVNRRLGYAPPHSKGPGVKKYVLTLYALSDAPKLSVPAEQVDRNALLAAIKDRVLATSDLNVTYDRTGVISGSSGGGK